MNKCCKSKSSSDSHKGLEKEIRTAIEALAPELSPIQSFVVAKLVKKMVKCSGKSKDCCKGGCKCCDKCKCGCQDKGCCKGGYKCCDKCQCGCCDAKKERGCCKECCGGCECCEKCQCGCRGTSDCCKGGCQCCSKCQCGCQDKKKQGNCCKGGCKCCDKCRCGCRDRGCCEEKKGCYEGKCECCDKCQCGCRDKECCKDGCKCCDKCRCGCQKKPDCCKGGCKCCEKCRCGCCDGKCGCKTECKKEKKMDCTMKIKEVVGKILGSEKAKVLKMMQVGFEAFEKVNGIPIPTERSKATHKFAKKAAKLLCKMQDKKRQPETAAAKFWKKASDKCMKKLLKKGKELASKMLFYKSCECDNTVRKGIVKAASRALCIARVVKPSCKEEEKKECAKGEKCKGFAAKFVSEFIDKNKEGAVACSNAIKQALDDFLKGAVPPCCVEKFRAKIAPRIIADAIALSNCETKPSDFYVEVANRYIKGGVCFCEKKCVKSCAKVAKIGLLFGGMKGECKAHVAACWAGVMCCRENGKTGCSRETCVEFFKKWIKEFAPTVEEAFKAMEEMKEEFGKGGRMKCKVMRRVLLEYLKLYCIDGKFDKADFQARLKKMMETLKEKCCKTEATK
eukprot:TRINITY_DN1855_c0_g6_i1.p1 TRINITY_DN1855_c0_g6~~TRINITY_DN1855_c0_g6_i1.p1  ORF type:complete len:620 (+),score=183.50 TRINITY_DN1855_c0_g6_i1:235-2094(+)